MSLPIFVQDAPGKKIFLFMRNTLLNKCHLKLPFLYVLMRNICNYFSCASLFELVSYAQTSEQGIKDWWGCTFMSWCSFHCENLQNRARLYTNRKCCLPLNGKDFDILQLKFPCVLSLQSKLSSLCRTSTLSSQAHPSFSSSHSTGEMVPQNYIRISSHSFTVPKLSVWHWNLNNN